MKYHPIADEKWFFNRDYVGKKWSRKAIRTVQAILNSTHGKIGKGRTFFFKAFGRDEPEFEELLKMPEAFIIKRWDAEISGLTDAWRKAYAALSETERSTVDRLVDAYDFETDKTQHYSARIQKVLDFHRTERESIPNIDKKEKMLRIQAFDLEMRRL